MSFSTSLKSIFSIQAANVENFSKNKLACFCGNQVPLLESVLCADNTIKSVMLPLFLKKSHQKYSLENSALKLLSKISPVLIQHEITPNNVKMLPNQDVEKEEAGTPQEKAQALFRFVPKHSL